jgi:DNA-binding MarR family transcriptional regulator
MQEPDRAGESPQPGCSGRPEHLPDAAPEEVVEAVLRASRALVAVAARSLAAAGEEVSLPQYRMLVVLATRGPRRMAELAEALAVNASTATRMVDRLVRKQLVRRNRVPSDRRTVRITLSPNGRALVGSVSEARRSELSRVVQRVPVAQRPLVVEALSALARAAGEPVQAPAPADHPVPGTAFEGWAL